MTEEKKVPEFSMSDFGAADVADMTVVSNGKLTDWVWTFAGPGHPQTIAQNNSLARERLHQDRQIEQQRANGKKVKLPEETPEEVRGRTVDWIVGRLVGWSPVRIDGQDYPFTAENARKLLADQRNVALSNKLFDILREKTS